ncbi:MAG: HlyD family efflux transporter periplasmic adaptor subunit [Saprospiraceae bacterium]|nr:HlyD family efflux transporter periplasmic adaptor subunit [Saprospiraceae bacterium]
MTQSREYVELRSEDVQEILGTPPGWLVRWGTMVVLVGFLMMLIAAWFVRYPDVVEGKVVITTATPPADVVARIDGRIARFLVKDTIKVPENHLLAVLQSTANYLDVLTLDTCVQAWQRKDMEQLRAVEVPRTLDLGDLQTEYSEFIQNLELYKFGKQTRTATTSSNIVSINLQISRLEQSIDYDKKATRRVKDQLASAEELHRKQKELVDQGIVSKSDYERERGKIAELERTYDEYNESVIRKQNEIINLRRGITDVSFNRDENEASVATRLRNSLNALRSSLDKWKQTYLLTAPITGTVSLNTSFFSANQYVKQGDQVLTIVPSEKGALTGRMLLAVAGSGKVTPGQHVLIKLDGYPYHEYGTLQGIVVTKSLVPKNDQYAISISLTKTDNKLITTFHREIPFEQQLQGKADIITEDKGLLERIGEQLFASVR